MLIGLDLETQKFCSTLVVDFPLLEWDEETNRFYAKHHPFTSPKPEDIPLLDKSPADVRANAYDLVINGIEMVEDPSEYLIKICKNKMLKILGFRKKMPSFIWLLMNAFQYGSATSWRYCTWLRQICALLGSSDSIRDFIAFLKHAGRDVMIDSPAKIADLQLKELHIKILE